MFYRLLQAALLIVCLLLLGNALLLETFYVPTGSMAPALHGEHHACRCPRCGNHVAIGKHPAESTGRSSKRLYRNAACPWCGEHLSAAAAPLVPGDRVLVDKLSLLWRRPRRWEIVVLQLWDEHFIKRILGLPGDEILLADGDVFVNGDLLRKTWTEMEMMRVPIFDQNLPGPDGWKDRWYSNDEHQPAGTRSSVFAAPTLELDARHAPATLSYRNFSYPDGKCAPLTDEQPYNGGLHPNWEHVHDFMVEAEIEVIAGQGTCKVFVFDGADRVEIALPLAALAPHSDAGGKGDDSPRRFRPAVRCKLEFAFVDRRASVRVDGREIAPPRDLPPVKSRQPVIEPVRFEADGVALRLHGVKLYRDAHYTQSGENGVKGRPVRLGPGQYFVLGDNSGRSEDSRFWPDQGIVPLKSFLGRVVGKR